MRNINFIPEPIKKKRRNLHSLGQLRNPNGLTESERPLAFKQIVPGRRFEKWRKRKEKGHEDRPEGYDFRYVWRHPEGSSNGGKFAKRPLPGERAKRLGLTK